MLLAVIFSEAASSSSAAVVAADAAAISRSCAVAGLLADDVVAVSCDSGGNEHSSCPRSVSCEFSSSSSSPASFGDGSFSLPPPSAPAAPGLEGFASSFGPSWFRFAPVKTAGRIFFDLGCSPPSPSSSMLSSLLLAAAASAAASAGAGADRLLLLPALATAKATMDVCRCLLGLVVDASAGVAAFVVPLGRPPPPPPTAAFRWPFVEETTGTRAFVPACVPVDSPRRWGDTEEASGDAVRPGTAA
jgi:hypothetical protein